MEGRPFSDETIALTALKPHPKGQGAYGFSVRAARPEGARDDAARRWLRPVKQSQASASSAIAAAHVPTSAAAPSSSPPSATAAAPAAAAKAARGAAKATRPVGKAARAAAKEARWVLLSSALAQRGAPKVGERVQGKYQVRHVDMQMHMRTCISHSTWHASMCYAMCMRWCRESCECSHPSG